MLEFGVSQARSTSPLLYVLVSEVLGACIRQCPGVQGFQLPGAGGLKLGI